MNKLEEYRDKLIKTDYPSEGQDSHYCDLGDIQALSFEGGFDAAIALDLPVKFAEWHFREVEYAILREDYYYITGNITFHSAKELYLYWINNVFKVE